MVKIQNYHNGKIYKIVNEISSDIYIGSTCACLNTRIAQHRYMSKKYPDLLFYKFVFNNNGWLNFRIILIEDYPCKKKEELLMREQYYKDSLKPTLNTNNVVGRDKQKVKECEKRRNQKENRKEKQKIYYQKHIKSEKYLITLNLYKETHKNELKERKKLYYEKNKKTLIEKSKLRQQIKYECVCGSVCSIADKSKHVKTKKHCNFINQN